MNAPAPSGHSVLYRALVVDADAVPEPGVHVADRPTHWTWDLEWAKHFATDLAESNWDADGNWDETKQRVILVAHDIGPDDLVTDPEVIAELRHGFDVAEPEAVIATGRPVQVNVVLVLGDFGRWEPAGGPPTGPA